MFHVLNLTYTEPPDVIDGIRPAHLEWLAREVADGRLILTGRLESGKGGILITGDISTEEAQDVIAKDPYHLAGVVHYERVGFTAGVRAASL
jgi:uncharacterized protein YciI